MRGGHVRNRRDENEPEIIEALEARGVQVFRLDRPVDLLCTKGGQNYLVEVKNGPNAKLTPAQNKFISDWPAPVFVVRDASDVSRVVDSFSASVPFEGTIGGGDK